MSQREQQQRRYDHQHWLAMFLMFLLVAAYGGHQVAAGQLPDPDVFHDPVFSPYVVMIGILGMVVALVIGMREK
jgi:hypothetical protein